jgi:hypothetical protein
MKNTIWLKIRRLARKLVVWWWRVRFTLYIAGRAGVNWRVGMDIAKSWRDEYGGNCKDDGFCTFYTPSEAVQEELSCWRD